MQQLPPSSSAAVEFFVERAVASSSADLAFKLAHLHGQGRLADRAILRRPPEMPVAGERGQITQLAPTSLPWPRSRPRAATPGTSATALDRPATDRPSATTTPFSSCVIGRSAPTKSPSKSLAPTAPRCARPPRWSCAGYLAKRTGDVRRWGPHRGGVRVTIGFPPAPGATRASSPARAPGRRADAAPRHECAARRESRAPLHSE